MATRTKKLNKSAQWKLINDTIHAVIDSTDLVAKTKKDNLLLELIGALEFLRPKTGGSTNSTKINDEGLVYCNYFETYLEPSEFNTKLSKPNKTTGERIEGYKANCKTAETILRKIKALKAKVTKQVTEAFRAKYLTEEEFDTILNKLDEVTSTKYETLEDVPTAADVVGLTETMVSETYVVYDTDMDLTILRGTEAECLDFLEDNDSDYYEVHTEADANKIYGTK